MEMPFSRSMFSSASIISEFIAVPVLLRAFGAVFGLPFLDFDFEPLASSAHSNTVRAWVMSSYATLLGVPSSSVRSKPGSSAAVTTPRSRWRPWSSPARS